MLALLFLPVTVLSYVAAVLFSLILWFYGFIFVGALDANVEPPVGEIIELKEVQSVAMLKAMEVIDCELIDEQIPPFKDISGWINKGMNSCDLNFLKEYRHIDDAYVTTIHARVTYRMKLKGNNDIEEMDLPSFYVIRIKHYEGNPVPVYTHSSPGSDIETALNL